MIKSWETKSGCGRFKGGHLGAQKNALRSVGTRVHHPEGFESCLELWMSFKKCSLYVFYLCVCAQCPRSPEDAGPGVRVVVSCCVGSGD